MTKKIKSFLFFMSFLGLFWACSATKATNEQSDSKYFNKKYIQSIMIDATDWQLKNPKHNLKDWTNGAFYAGVFAAWETTRSEKIYDALLRMGNTNQWEPFRRFYHADDVTICQTYIDLYQLENKPEMIRPTMVVRCTVYGSSRYDKTVEGNGRTRVPYP